MDIDSLEFETRTNLLLIEQRFLETEKTKIEENIKEDANITNLFFCIFPSVILLGEF